MSIGWHNPCPFQVGGGSTQDELIYEALKSAVGEGGIATSETGIDALWRRCRAQTHATVASFSLRAALQALPNRATDHIPVYEAFLNIIPGDGANDVDRRAAITEGWTRHVESDEPDLIKALQAIDPRATTLALPRATAITTVLGKAFEPQDGTPTYGPSKATGFPNFSTDFYCPVVLNLPYLVPTAADLLIIEKIKRLLRDVLPSWVDFAIMTSSPGFLLDISHLDLTALT